MGSVSVLQVRNVPEEARRALKARAARRGQSLKATADLAATSRRVQGAPLAGFARGPHVGTPDPAYRRR